MLVPGLGNLLDLFIDLAWGQRHESWLVHPVKTVRDSRLREQVSHVELFIIHGKLVLSEEDLGHFRLLLSSLLLSWVTCGNGLRLLLLLLKLLELFLR